MRTVGQAVRTMPDNLLNTVDEVFDGITKVFQNRAKNFDDPMKVGSTIHQEVRWDCVRPFIYGTNSFK